MNSLYTIFIKTINILNGGSVMRDLSIIFIPTCYMSYHQSSLLLTSIKFVLVSNKYKEYKVFRKMYQV